MAQPQPQPQQQDQEELRKKLESMSPEELKEFQKKQCIFCHIVSGKVAAKKVYEDDKTLAVLDINPANPGHVLLMPKEHYMVMPQMPENEISHIFIIAKYISNALLKALDVRGTNIIVANGAAAGQRAQHFMIHIIPRKEGDGVEFTLPFGKFSEEDLDSVAATVKKKLSELIGIKEKPKTAEDILRENARKKVVEAEFKEEKRQEIPVEKPIEKKVEKPEEKKEVKEEKKKEEKESSDKDEDDEDSDELDLDSIAKVLHGR